MSILGVQSKCVTQVSATESRYSLRSSESAHYVLMRIQIEFKECGFSFSIPAAWNELPTNLHNNTTRKF